ncbi:unnamed protein product [Symbiodinium microadriaticum]|nr:unnamed protein product [Symbiodinium microadriaticum]
MKFETWLGQTIDYMHYIYVIIAEVVKQFLHVLWEIVRSVFLYRRESTGASHLEEGDGRLFTFYFKTTDAVNKCKDIVDTLSALVCAKQGRLPPPNLSAISSPRYEISEQVVPVNASDKYGKDGGFFVLRRMWDLLDGEVVYDVLPTNYRISWRDLILCVITAGLYYLFRLHGRRRCRQSYMLTDRRLVSHAVRKAVCGSTVIYSCLQMWFLCPTLSFTIMRKKKSCCKYKSEFVTDSTRFGVLNLDMCNEPFMCTYLQVVGALSTSAAEKRVEAGSSKALIHDVAEMKQARFCQLFLEAGGEATLGVLGSTFPVACLQRLCWRQPVHCVLAVTSSAIYLEVYTKSVQIFTRIPTVMLRSVYCSNVQTRSALCCWKNSETYQYPLLGYSGAQIRMNIMGSNGFQTGLVLPGRYHGRPEDQELSDLSSLLKRQASRLHLRDVIALSDIMLDGGMED